MLLFECIYLNTFINNFCRSCLCSPISICAHIWLFYLFVVKWSVLIIFIAKDIRWKIFKFFVSTIFVNTTTTSSIHLFNRWINMSLISIFPISTISHKCTITLFACSINHSTSTVQFFIFSLLCCLFKSWLLKFLCWLFLPYYSHIIWFIVKIASVFAKHSLYTGISTT